MKYKQEAKKLATTKKWRDIHKIWAEYKGKPRKEAVTNFRFKTGPICLAANFRKIGIYESPINIVVAFGFYHRCCYVYIVLSVSACRKI